MSSEAISVKNIKLRYGFYAAHLESRARDNYFIVNQIIKHPSDYNVHQSYVLNVSLN